MTRPVLILLAMLLGVPLWASPWDRDRPGDNFLPSVTDACAGRVDLLPPEYYEARVSRLQDALKDRPLTTPDDLMAVDDHAVALLRLGRFANAIIWLDRKQAPTEAMREADGRAANFHADRTLKNKAMCLLARWRQQADPADLDAALDLLRKAEEASRHLPENWFLVRELEYLKQRQTINGTMLPNMLAVTEETFRGARKPGALSRARLTGAIEQLVRRVTYGGERENPDLFYALSLACALEGRDAEANYAFLRATALIEGGARLACRHGLGPSALRQAMSAHLRAEKQAEYEAQMKGLETAAAAWRGVRQQYVSDGLKRGEHPDTHPQFWAGWKEEDRPTPGATTRDTTYPAEPIVGTAMFIGGGAMILFLFLVVGGMAIYFARRHPPGPNVDEL